MAKDLRYWDACAFSGFLNDEADKADSCQAVLKAARDGHILIVTSALTLAEVLFVKGGTRVDPTKRKLVEDFFKAEYLAVRNVTRNIGELARDVFWDHGIKPKDAIHVATAALFKVPLLNTFDEGLLEKSGIVINGHTIATARPHYVEQLELPVSAVVDQDQQRH